MARAGWDEAAARFESPAVIVERRAAFAASSFSMDSSPNDFNVWCVFIKSILPTRPPFDRAAFPREKADAGRLFQECSPPSRPPVCFLYIALDKYQFKVVHRLLTSNPACRGLRPRQSPLFSAAAGGHRHNTRSLTDGERTVIGLLRRFSTNTDRASPPAFLLPAICTPDQFLPQRR